MKTSTPKTNNKTWKERELWSAASVHLQDAIAELKKIANDPTMASEEAKYYAANIKELLNSDGGEAGINAIIENLTRKIEAQ
jgi:hypothetical protein